MFKLKTVDVWDTLLRRICHPDEIKLATARYFYLQYYPLHQENDAFSLFRYRVLLEKKLGQEAVQQGLDDEYAIKEVFYRLVKQSIVIPLSQDEMITIADDLVDFELAHEKRCTYLDPTIKNFLHRFPAEQTLFLSDFYMPAAALVELLEHHGVNDIVASGIVSADVGCNKRSGRLFDYVAKKFNVAAEDWIHIGDNHWSDVEMPLKRGIHAEHFIPEREHHQRTIKERNFDNKQQLLSSIQAQVVRLLQEKQQNWRVKLTQKIALSAQEQQEQQQHTEPAFMAGVQATPLVIGYCLFIVEQCIENNCQQVYFFSREGEFVIQAVRQIIAILQQSMPNVTLPRCEILEVSRLATFCASLQEVSIEEMMRIWRLYNPQSYQALLKTLDLDRERFLPYAHALAIDPHESITCPWKDPRIIALFSDPDFQAAVKQQSQQKRQLLMAYLNSKGLNQHSGQVCVVDIGWRGTIQDNIALLYPTVNFVGVYLGLQKYFNPQPANGLKYAFGPNLNHKVEFSHLLDSVAPLEMVFNSPAGSVVGYRAQDEHYQAMRDVDERENQAYYRFSCYFQQGILYGIQAWSTQLVTHAVSSKDLRPLSLSIWCDLLADKGELSDTFSNLTHNEVFGLGAYVDKKQDVPSTVEILKGIYSIGQFRQIVAFIKRNQWVGNIRCRRDLSAVNKYLLIFIIKLAGVYKKVFLR